MRTVYDHNLWNSIGMVVANMEDFVAASIYASLEVISEIFLPEQENLPILLHIAGSSPTSTSSTIQQTAKLNHYSYPKTESPLFATPFQPHFNYAAEAVSHT